MLTAVRKQKQLENVQLFGHCQSPVTVNQVATVITVSAMATGHKVPAIWRPVRQQLLNGSVDTCMVSKQCNCFVSLADCGNVWFQANANAVSQCWLWSTAVSQCWFWSFMVSGKCNCCVSMLPLVIYGFKQMELLCSWYNRHYIAKETLHTIRLRTVWSRDYQTNVWTSISPVDAAE